VWISEPSQLEPELKKILGSLPQEAAAEVLEVWGAHARLGWTGTEGLGVVMPEAGVVHPGSVWAIDDFLDDVCGLRDFCLGRQTPLTPSQRYPGK
jgi:hypothetical protein